MLAKTVPRMRGSPATAIHNARQIPDGLDADAPLEAPQRRARPLRTSALQPARQAVTPPDMPAGPSAEAALVRESEQALGFGDASGNDYRPHSRIVQINDRISRHPPSSSAIVGVFGRLRRQG